MKSSTLTRGMGIKANAETDIIRNKLREIVLTLGVMQKHWFLPLSLIEC